MSRKLYKKKNRKWYSSFRNAFTGYRSVFLLEAHFTVHLVLALAALGLATYYQVSRSEWLVIILVITVVLAAEIFNTCIEKLVDMVQPGYSKKAGQIKDMAAAGVLTASVGALFAGVIIFGPRILPV